MGLREDLLDIITIIDPDDAPAVATFEKTTTNGLFHEWLLDTLAATSTAGAFEGDSFSATSLSTRKRLNNYVQRFRKDFAVSNDQIELSRRGGVAGVKNEMDYQATKAGQELTRNVDARLWSTGSASFGSVSGASGTAPLFANIRAFGTPTAGISGVTANQSGTWSTGALYTLHEAMYKAGAKPDTIFVGPGSKVNLSRALLGDSAYGTAIGTGNGLTLAKDNTVVAGGIYGPVIEIVRTDFGRAAVVIDRWIPESTATASASATSESAAWYLIEKSRIRLAYWRPLKAYPVAPQGDFMAAYMLAALTVEVLHPSCVGVAYNTTST